MQCKDVPTRPILEFLLKHEGQWCFNFPEHISDRTVLLAVPSGTPWKVLLAKMERLIKKELVSGCPCGCRGDYEITDKGKHWLQVNHIDKSH